MNTRAPGARTQSNRQHHDAIVSAWDLYSENAELQQDSDSLRQLEQLASMCAVRGPGFLTESH